MISEADGWAGERCWSWRRCPQDTAVWSSAAPGKSGSWRPDLGSLGGFSVATDINEHGQIFGYSDTYLYSLDTRAFLWEAGVLTELAAPR